MSDQKDSMIFYRSFYEAVSELDQKSQGKIYSAIFDYSFNMKEPDLQGIAKTVFRLIKPQLDANHRRYENGSKAKTKQNGSKTEASDKQTTSKSEANKNKNNNVNNNDNKNENNNRNVNSENVAVPVFNPINLENFEKVISEEIEPDHLFREPILMQTKVSESEFTMLIQDYISEQKQFKHTGWQGESDLRKHISYWIKKKIQNGNNNRNKGSNGSSRTTLEEFESF